MRYGLAGAIAAIGIGAAIGAVLPVPEDAVPHESDRHHAVPARPGLAIGRTADYDYDRPPPGTYALPTVEPAADGVASRGAVGTDGRLTWP